MTGVVAWPEWVDEQCRLIEQAGRWRRVRTFDAGGPVGTLPASAGQRDVVSFASNDYLGLSQHPKVKAAAIEAIQRWGTGAGASRLVVGSRPVHDDLEAALAEWRGNDAALLFPTGYAANTGTLAALAGPDVVICSDELNHASIVDGCRMARQAGAEICVYPHGDVEAVERMLGAAGSRRAVVVSDTVFSMDGDIAPVEGLAQACARHEALLVLDDAHLVLGAPGVPDGVEVLRVGTLSKTLGSLGGYVTGRRPLIDLLVNRARPFVFTTAPTPADAAAAHAALDVIRSDEGAQLTRRLADHVRTLRPGHATPIIPVVVGDERAALTTAAELLERGLLVPAIRPPTVPPGTSRLRIALSAAHTADQIAFLASALRSSTVVGGEP
jgi:8-amino-7-oxononanoate synthase